uniref:Transposase Helix-turn-helix domain-containing protein n=1 Tax=Cacopsylla melanoneura TaxID=428564 RepID=A0A8D8QC39_9HEMI
MKKTSANSLVKLILQTTPGFNTIWISGLEPMTACKKVLVALMYLSSQEPMRKIGDKFNLCDSSVYRCINEFMECVGQSRDQLIRWPQGEDQALVSQQGSCVQNFPSSVLFRVYASTPSSSLFSSPTFSNHPFSLPPIPVSLPPIPVSLPPPSLSVPTILSIKDKNRDICCCSINLAAFISCE